MGTILAPVAAVLMLGLAQAAHADAGADCAPDDGGIELADGFCASVFADDLGTVRHLAVDGEGDVYAILREARQGKGLVALRDGDGDGRAERTERFGEVTDTGIAVHDGHLYYASTTAVYRRPLAEGELVPSGERRTVVSGFPEQSQHAAKSLALDAEGGLYVNVGAPSNACQEQMRTKGSPGMDPCPQRERQAGIWRVAAGETGQTQQDDGERYAAGIRNAVALAWSPVADNLYAVQHGRDQLSQFWPDLYDAQDNAELPAEELFEVDEGDDFGWPFCYYDQRRGEKVLAPEYGGDGEEVGRCADFEDPVAAFPGHWGPNALAFYTGEQFPERYHGGAFIAFHGSWNRAPLPQAGYNVVFVPFDDGRPAGDYEVFAEGFKGTDELRAPGNAEYRPTGLAQGPDGALYISDSQKGRIWRVVYRGDGAD